MVRKQCPVLELANQMPVRNMDLARAPRRTARKKGSGYENVLSNELMRYFINTSIATTVMKLRQRTASSPGSSMCVGFAPLRSESTHIFPLLLSTHVSPERPSRAGDEAGPGTVQHQTKTTSAFLRRISSISAWEERGQGPELD